MSPLSTKGKRNRSDTVGDGDHPTKKKAAAASTPPASSKAKKLGTPIAVPANGMPALNVSGGEKKKRKKRKSEVEAVREESAQAALDVQNEMEVEQVDPPQPPPPAFTMADVVETAPANEAPPVEEIDEEIIAIDDDNVEMKDGSVPEEEKSSEEKESDSEEDDGPKQGLFASAWAPGTPSPPTASAKGKGKAPAQSKAPVKVKGKGKAPSASQIVDSDSEDDEDMIVEPSFDLANDFAPRPAHLVLWREYKGEEQDPDWPMPVDYLNWFHPYHNHREQEIKQKIQQLAGTAIFVATYGSGHSLAKENIIDRAIRNILGFGPKISPAAKPWYIADVRTVENVQRLVEVGVVVNIPEALPIYFRLPTKGPQPIQILTLYTKVKSHRDESWPEEARLRVYRFLKAAPWVAKVRKSMVVLSAKKDLVIVRLRLADAYFRVPTAVNIPIGEDAVEEWTVRQKDKACFYCHADDHDQYNDCKWGNLAAFLPETAAHGGRANRTYGQAKGPHPAKKTVWEDRGRRGPPRVTGSNAIAGPSSAGPSNANASGSGAVNDEEDA
ncbi:hypothetical protein PLICRDRAFT_557027 [Plicaturopsis crispa FD-325 SS-3]|uniref:Uncharacterized protein n=1 Tax=Plicaturopsis crispa FD-325 SS-3 TaxID=944288 RepID=A0A0C9SPP7_PLICR|nr:hypothetical protein PLICRDRAFT_557027 [Plicaturopsis crispa FD-325 SS-3]